MAKFVAQSSNSSVRTHSGHQVILQKQEAVKPFETLLLNYEKWDEVNTYVNTKLSAEDADRVKSLVQFLAGYTSELSLEILATVDFILQENPHYSFDQVMQAIAQWNLRKKELFKREYVENAYGYLKAYGLSIMEFVD